MVMPLLKRSLVFRLKGVDLPKIGFCSGSDLAIQSSGAPPHSSPQRVRPSANKTQARIELNTSATFWSAALVRRFGLPVSFRVWHYGIAA
jgi:hypothetical protein